MGLFGGSSSKKKTITNTTTNTSSDDDNFSDLDADQIFNDTGDITILDSGAIEGAFGFGENSLSFAESGLSNILDFGREIVGVQQENAKDSLNTLSALRGADQSLVSQSNFKTFAFAGVGALALFFLARRKA